MKVRTVHAILIWGGWGPEVVSKPDRSLRSIYSSRSFRMFIWKYMEELLPEWMRIVKVSKGIFIKIMISKSTDLKTIMKTLEKAKSIILTSQS